MTIFELFETMQNVSIFYYYYKVNKKKTLFFLYRTGKLHLKLGKLVTKATNTKLQRHLFPF